MVQVCSNCLYVCFQLNCFYVCLWSSGLLSFVIVIFVMAWVDISRRVWRSGSQWVNSGCICYGLHMLLLGLLYTVILGYQLIDVTAYITYSWELCATSLCISTRCFLRPSIDCHYLCIHKQATIWYLLDSAYHDLTCHSVFHHTLERICVYSWCTCWPMYSYMRPHDLMTIYIWELESLFSISTLVATRKTKCTYTFIPIYFAWIWYPTRSAILYSIKSNVFSTGLVHCLCFI